VRGTFFSIFFSISIWCSPSIPKEIVVGYFEDFPPYTFEKNGKVTGIFPDMLAEVNKLTGIKIKYTKLPWKRLLANAKNGEIDAVMPLFKTREREAYYYYPSRGCAVAEVLFFTWKDFNIDYTGNFQELIPYNIGIVEEYFYGDDFDNANYLLKDVSPSDEALMEKFSKGRFKIGVGTRRVIEFYAQKFGIRDKIKFLEPPLVIKSLYIAFSKKKIPQEFVNTFSSALEKMEKQGKYSEILSKYGCSDDIPFFKPIIIGCDQEDYPPYSYWEKDKLVGKDNLKGICVEIIEKASQIVDVKISYEKITWSNLRNLVNKKKIDAVMPLFKNKEREKILYFPGNGLIAEKNHFYSLKKPELRYFSTLRDLKGIPLGVVDGYSYGDELDSASFIPRKKFPTVKSLVQGLINGEVRAIVGNDRVIVHYANQLEVGDKIKSLEFPLLPTEFIFLAFSRLKGPGYDKLGWSFSQAIEELRKTGQYQDIARKYGMEKQTVLLAADNWQPYQGENLPNGGPISEIIVEAFKRVGYNLRIEFMPWASVLEKVKKGKYDGGFSAAYEKQRAGDFFFSNPVAESPGFRFYTRKDTTIACNKLEDLKGYRIGVVRGYIYGPKFDEMPGLKKIAGNSEETNLINLVNGNLDVVIMDQLHAQYLLNKMPEKKEKISQLPLLPNQKGARDILYLIISKAAAASAQVKIDFNHGLKLIINDGTFDMILKKYGVGHAIYKK